MTFAAVTIVLILTHRQLPRFFSVHLQRGSVRFCGTACSEIKYRCPRPVIEFRKWGNNERGTNSGRRETVSRAPSGLLARKNNGERVLMRSGHCRVFTRRGRLPFVIFSSLSFSLLLSARLPRLFRHYLHSPLAGLSIKTSNARFISFRCPLLRPVSEGRGTTANRWRARRRQSGAGRRAKRKESRSRQERAGRALSGIVKLSLNRGAPRFRIDPVSDGPVVCHCTGDSPSPRRP